MVFLFFVIFLLVNLPGGAAGWGKACTFEDAKGNEVPVFVSDQREFRIDAAKPGNESRNLSNFNVSHMNHVLMF